jgi:hypothetical protein
VAERYKLKGYNVHAKHYRKGWRVFITKAVLCSLHTQH